jgi:hypothetical protein
VPAPGHDTRASLLMQASRRTATAWQEVAQELERIQRAHLAQHPQPELVSSLYDSVSRLLIATAEIHRLMSDRPLPVLQLPAALAV